MQQWMSCYFFSVMINVQVKSIPVSISVSWMDCGIWFIATVYRDICEVKGSSWDFDCFEGRDTSIPVFILLIRKYKGTNFNLQRGDRSCRRNSYSLNIKPFMHLKAGKRLVIASKNFLPYKFRLSEISLWSGHRLFLNHMVESDDPEWPFSFFYSVKFNSNFAGCLLIPSTFE